MDHEVNEIDKRRERELIVTASRSKKGYDFEPLSWKCWAHVSRFSANWGGTVWK